MCPLGKTSTIIMENRVGPGRQEQDQMKIRSVKGVGNLGRGDWVGMGVAAASVSNNTSTGLY